MTETRSDEDKKDVQAVLQSNWEDDTWLPE
ncbi:hypothetical protein [Entomohabitans teleogrylli]